MDRAEARAILESMKLIDFRFAPKNKANEALDLAIEALKQTVIVRCKDCKHYNPPHIEYNDGTRKDYPDGFVTVDIGMNVGGKCENSTTTMRTYCTAHDRENPDDFEEIVIFRNPMEYCSFGEKAEKHQLSGETSTNFGVSEDGKTSWFAEEATAPKEMTLEEWQELDREIRGDAESATTTDCNYTCSDCKHQDKAYEQEPCYSCFNNDGAGYEPDTDCISRADTIKAMCRECKVFPDDVVNCADCDDVAVVKSMPPVEPERPKGEWILVDHLWQCDQCQYRQNKSKPTKFCPNCGAMMKGEK